MNLSIAIQSHPARAAMAAVLAARIEGAVIVTDPEPEGRPAPWRTYRHALELTPADATHRLIVQDDAEVCDGFAAAAAAAIAAQPDRPVVLFVGGRPTESARAVLHACSRDLAWAELGYGRWCPVVATSWPAAMIGPMLEFVDRQRWPVRFQADDEITGRFLRHTRVSPLATVPSLAQHPDITPSLIGKRDRAGDDPGRIAACWIGDCNTCDPAAIDWTAGP